MFIDLSYEIFDGMRGLKMKNGDGSVTQFRVTVRPFLTHAQTRPNYQNKAEFEITEVSFQTSIGTYLDAPYHRFKDKRAIGNLRLEEVVLDGVVINARGMNEREPFDLARMPRELDVRGRAVLFHFGWDKYWETPQYEAYPFIARDVVEWLVTQGAKLVGVDTLNVDDTRDPARPTHTRLLQNDILIVENLRNLGALPVAPQGKHFRFYAVPIQVRGAAAMPVRAFAEVT
ncbi:MAG TPA: cyclase family protein [Anaerolineae bacterium]|nr:cyclase family protein [Anaerolineae bacterium]